MIALVNATVIDGTGAAPRPCQRVLVDGEKIFAIGRKIAIPEDAEIVDLQGRFLLPGLIDAHVHFGNGYRKGIASAEETDSYRDMRNLCLANGVTTVRSCGDWMEDVLDFRDQVNAGKLRGPRVIACGKHFMSQESHPAATVWGDNPGTIQNCGAYPQTPEEGRQMVREFVEQGADFIKILISVGHHSVWPRTLPPIPMPIVEAIIEEAHKQGKRTACHVETLETALAVVDVGADEVHHLMMCASEYAEVPRYRELFEKMCRKQVWLCPTVVIPRRNEDVRVAKKIGGSGIDHIVDVFRFAYQMGVPISCGTDCGAPATPWGISLHGEMDEYVESFGMTPLEAIRTATWNNARVLGMDGEIGQIVAGAYADFLILSQDPSVDIRNTGKIYQVYHNGKLVWGEGAVLKEEDLPNPKRVCKRW